MKNSLQKILKRIQVKNIVTMGLVALMLIGGGVTFMGQKKTLYRGLEKLDLKKAQASIVFADEYKPDQTIPVKVARKTQKSDLSCESKGKFTYTGPDLPGLLYGMCINCETMKFTKNGNRCK